MHIRLTSSKSNPGPEILGKTDFIVFFLSIVKIGAIAIPTSILLKKRELKYIIKNSKPSAVISKTLINFFSEENIKVLKPGKINNKPLYKYSMNIKKTLANDPCYITYTKFVFVLSVK